MIHELQVEVDENIEQVFGEVVCSENCEKFIINMSSKDMEV